MTLLDAQLQPPLLSFTPSAQDTARGGLQLLQQHSPHSSRKRVTSAAVAAVVSLVMLVAVFAACLPRRHQQLSQGEERRSLSDTEEDSGELSSIIDQCLELEEHGFQLPVPELVEEEREAQERLTAILRASAAEFERSRALRSTQVLPSQGLMTVDEDTASMRPTPAQLSPAAVRGGHSGGGVAPVAGLTGKGEGFVSPKGEPRWDDAFAEGGRSLELSNEARARAAAPTAMDTSSFVNNDADVADVKSLGRHWSSRRADTAAAAAAAAFSPEAWLEEPSANDRPPVVQQREEATHSTLRKLLLGLIKAPDYMHAHPAPRRPPMTLAEMVGEGKHEEPATSYGTGSATTSEDSPSTASMEATSSSGGDQDGWSEGLDLNLHPFVRFPTVDREAVRRNFRPEFALSVNLNIPSPMESYTTMRRLFAKQSLNVKDMEMLMIEAENLANYAKDKLTRPCTSKKSSYIFRKLSSIFMAFDYLVSTIELLGDKMVPSSWWPEFASVFQTEFNLPEKVNLRRTRGLNIFINRLSAALSIYKEGKRPPIKEIIELKRLVLTQQCKGNQLTNPLWELWLEDDKRFLRSRDSSESSSDSEAQDEQKEDKQHEA